MIPNAEELKIKELLFRRYGYSWSINRSAIALHNIIGIWETNRQRSVMNNNRVNFGFDDGTDRSFTERLGALRPHK